MPDDVLENCCVTASNYHLQCELAIDIKVFGCIYNIYSYVASYSEITAASEWSHLFALSVFC